MDTIGIGLIGTGYMGKCHALAWNAVRPVFGDGPKPRLVHLAEADVDLATARADAFGFEKATADWRDLLADQEVDAISVTTPNAFHPEMAIAALKAGKHVWCEKPMAPKLKDAERMRDVARRAGRVAALGYNYIQNPTIRHMGKLIDEGAIGTVNHVRVEMDEDFMADPEAQFYWKSESASGHGAIDDFAVHPLSLIAMLLGPISGVMADMARPYADRPVSDGRRRAVENFDIASVLLRFASGATGVLMADRAAWGRKGRLALQVFGSRGSVLFDQERMNEIQVFQNTGDTGEQGFRTILTGPAHPPYDRFVPAPGHGLGFNDLKIIECHEFLNAIGGAAAHLVDFDTGYEIERLVDAMARSHRDGKWVHPD